MLERVFLQMRIERVVAGARLALAVIAAVALVADAAQPLTLRTSITVLLTAYLAFALGLVLLARRSPAGGALGVVAHGIDLCVFALLMVGTGGPGSPFFLLYTYSLVNAALLWGWKGALATVAAILCLLGAVMITHVWWGPPGQLEPVRLILRVGHVMVVGSLLVVVGHYLKRTAADLENLANWAPASARMDVEAITDTWLARLSETFGADMVLLVIDDGDEPYLQSTSFRDGAAFRDRLSLDTLGELVAPALAENAFLRLAQSRQVLKVGARGRLESWEGDAVPEAFEDGFRDRAIMSVPLRGGAVEGRLFVVDPDSCATEDLITAALATERLCAALDRCAALEAERRAAGSEERLSLSRDLHDGILQTLSGTVLHLEQAVREIGDAVPSATTRLRSTQDWLAGEQRHLRTFIEKLRPGYRSDPMESDAMPLAEFCDVLGRHWGLVITSDWRDMAAGTTPDLDYHLRQILREAVANAARHGRATRMRIDARRGRHGLALDLSDNGAGLGRHGRFDAEDCAVEGIGPRSLRERVTGLGGRFSLKSTPAGLHLTIVLPLAETATCHAS